MTYWLNNDSRKFLSRDYLQEGVTPEQRIREIAEAAEDHLQKPGFADKFEDYMHRGFYSLASPIWANYGLKRGLPISCNGSYVADSTADIMTKVSEVAIMTKYGAGVSAFFGPVRGRGAEIGDGGVTDGSVSFMEIFESVIKIIAQGSTRRGAMATYLPVDHPDIKEFLTIRDEGSPIHKLLSGVCISDEWMLAMLGGDKDKRKIWSRILQKRTETGQPYIFFTDAANNGAPDVYKDLNLKIHASNLCTEIMLHSSPVESFVCCLSSMNLLKYDEWKNTDAVEILTYFLDTVLTEYIVKTANIQYMDAARRFAVNQRAIGIGTLGWHSYLQSKGISFESTDASVLNVLIHKTIFDRAMAASKEMALLYGEPPLLKGYGRRNVTVCAIAPTTSSSFILGQVSPSVEPLNSNYFVKDLAKGKFTYKNPYLEKLLESIGQNTDKVWDSILIQGGSVQHLDFLTEHQKNIFKTFGEISQAEILMQAAQRQKFVDQGQSINLMIHPDAPAKDIHELMVTAWKLKLKSLYYQRSTNPVQQLARELLSCASCEA